MYYLQSGNEKIDYRLHENACFKFNMQNEICIISSLIRDSEIPMLSKSFTPGWYLPTQSLPVIRKDRNYFYFDSKGNKFPFIKPTKDVDVVYDNMSKSCVVTSGQIKKLRPYPTDDYRISNVIKAYYEDVMDYYSKWKPDYTMKAIDELMVERICYNDYTIDDYSNDVSDNALKLNELICRIADILDMYSEEISHIGAANPWAILLTSVKNGILTIKNTGDWRVSEYNRMIGEKANEEA